MQQNDVVQSETANPPTVGSSCRSDCLAEVLPGLWIGSLAGLRQLVKSCSLDIPAIGDGREKAMPPSSPPSSLNWAVITILDSEKLIGLTNLLLGQCPRFQNPDLKCGNVTTGSQRSKVVKHEVWRLEDHPKADFMSEKLTRILGMIDNALPSSTVMGTPYIQRQQVNDNEENSKACFVHCAQGISRSAAVCAAWYMSRRKSSLQEAMAAIWLVRPQAQPNLGFLAGLRALQQCDGNINDAIIRLSNTRGGHEADKEDQAI